MGLSPSTYPGTLDSFNTSHVTGEVIAASTDNDQADAINKVEAELGTNPSGSESTVAARFTSVESTMLPKTGGTLTVETTGPAHAFNVTTKNPTYPSGRARFAIENNQDTAPVDGWFHDVVLAIGHWDSASSADASLALYQPASPGTTNLLQVFKPGSQTQKVTYIGPNGGIFMAVGGLSSLALTVYTHGDANNKFQITETGKMQWGAGGASAVDVSLERNTTNELTLTASVGITMAGPVFGSSDIRARNGGATQVLFGSVGGNAGISFNSAADVTLTRPSANQLQLGTGDAFLVGAATDAGGNFIQLFEQTADPAAGATNTARLFAKDNGSGKTQFVVRFPTGATQVIATEP